MSTIEEHKRDFIDHKITEIYKNEFTSQYKFTKPGSWTFAMTITFGDNMILLQGDCYSMLWEPGYGRNGLAWLRGSVRSTGYFMEKCPFGDMTKKYDNDTAIENFKEHFQEDTEKLEEVLDQIGDDTGVEKYYDLCYEYGIDEPCSPRVLTSTAKMQIAGLQRFVEEYELMFAPVTVEVSV